MVMAEQDRFLSFPFDKNTIIQQDGRDLYAMQCYQVPPASYIPFPEMAQANESGGIWNAYIDVIDGEEIVRLHLHENGNITLDGLFPDSPPESPELVTIPYGTLAIASARNIKTANWDAQGTSWHALPITLSAQSRTFSPVAYIHDVYFFTPGEDKLVEQYTPGLN